MDLARNNPSPPPRAQLVGQFWAIGDRHGSFLRFTEQTGILPHTLITLRVRELLVRSHNSFSSALVQYFFEHTISSPDCITKTQLASSLLRTSLIADTRTIALRLSRANSAGSRRFCRPSTVARIANSPMSLRSSA